MNGFGCASIFYADGLRVDCSAFGVAVLRNGFVYNSVSTTSLSLGRLVMERIAMTVGGMIGSFPLGRDAYGNMAVFVGGSFIRIGGASGGFFSSGSTTVTINGRTVTIPAGGFGYTYGGDTDFGGLLDDLYDHAIEISGGSWGGDTAAGSSGTDDGLLYRGHAYFAFKNEGWCKRLVGNVTVVNLLVDDLQGSWDYSELRQFDGEVRRACARLETDAAASGARLSLKPVTKQIRIGTTVGSYGPAYWGSIAQALGRTRFEELHSAFLREYGGDELAIVIAPAFHARSHASTNDVRTPDYIPEYAVVYEDYFDRAAAYIHELLHLFGAEDFYYPAVTKNASACYLPNSIMDVSSMSNQIDDLTRYLIGWTNKLTPNARRFLDATRHLTLTDLDIARSQA